MTNLDVILSYIFEKTGLTRRRRNLAFTFHTSHCCEKFVIWDLFSSGLTCNESFIPVVTDILSLRSGGPRYGIMKVKVGTKLLNNYCQNHENDR